MGRPASSPLARAIFSANPQGRFRAPGQVRKLVFVIGGAFQQGVPVPLAQAERVIGRHLRTAVGGPGGTALGPATPLPRPGRVPVGLVGKATRPATGARVLPGAGLDLVDQAVPVPTGDERVLHSRGGSAGQP